MRQRAAASLLYQSKYAEAAFRNLLKLIFLKIVGRILAFYSIPKITIHAGCRHTHFWQGVAWMVRPIWLHRPHNPHREGHLSRVGVEGVFPLATLQRTLRLFAGCCK